MFEEGGYFQNCFFLYCSKIRKPKIHDPREDEKNCEGVVKGKIQNV